MENGPKLLSCRQSCQPIDSEYLMKRTLRTVTLVQYAASGGWEGKQQGNPCCSSRLDDQKEVDGEPDDLLCLRNARPEKALVGRAQWKIPQAPSQKR